MNQFHIFIDYTIPIWPLQEFFHVFLLQPPQLRSGGMAIFPLPMNCSADSHIFFKFSLQNSRFPVK